MYKDPSCYKIAFITAHNAVHVLSVTDSSLSTLTYHSEVNCILYPTNCTSPTLFTVFLNLDFTVSCQDTLSHMGPRKVVPYTITNIVHFMAIVCVRVRVAILFVHWTRYCYESTMFISTHSSSLRYQPFHRREELVPHTNILDLVHLWLVIWHEEIFTLLKKNTVFNVAFRYSGCILYRTRECELSLASGTVFNKILLWHLSSYKVVRESAERVKVSLTLTGHEARELKLLYVVC